MKTVSVSNIVLSFLFLACHVENHKEYEDKPFGKVGSSGYSGPIFDMHIHAYSEPDLTFGLEYTNPLTGKLYVGAKTIEQEKEKTYTKFKEFNTVKAMVSNGEEWYESDPERVIIGQDHYNSIEELRTLHKGGKLHVLGEVASNYAGLLPTDPSLAR